MTFCQSFVCNVHDRKIMPEFSVPCTMVSRILSRNDPFLTRLSKTPTYSTSERATPHHNKTWPIVLAKKTLFLPFKLFNATEIQAYALQLRSITCRIGHLLDDVTATLHDAIP